MAIQLGQCRPNWVNANRDKSKPYYMKTRVNPKAESKSPSKTPNFFIAGAPKAGTDSLYYALGQHPEIYMSPMKEPCYFSSEIRPENFASEFQARMQEQVKTSRDYARGEMKQKRFGGIVPDWNDYLQLFSGVKYETAIGEGSVCYLWSKSAPEAIAERVPGAKIIIVLMDPAERAFAQYRKSVEDGHTRYSFREQLEASLQYSNDKISLLHPFLEFGKYAEQIERYLAVFPRRQLNISFYGDAVTDYDRWFSQILAFLEVETHFMPNRQDLESGNKRAVMRDEDRSLLVDYYRENIRKLEGLLDRDLSAWLR